MRPRRFHDGEAFAFGNIQFRIVKGKKAADDLRLDWAIGDRWEPVTLDPIFYIVDFICENEDVLYPYPARGGEEVLSYLRLAKNSGWRKAVDKLHKARAEKQERLNEWGAE